MQSGSDVHPNHTFARFVRVVYDCYVKVLPVTTSTRRYPSSHRSGMPITTTAPAPAQVLPTLAATVMKLIGNVAYLLRRIRGGSKVDSVPPAKPLSSAQLLELAARKQRPPQSWYDEPSPVEPVRR